MGKFLPVVGGFYQPVSAAASNNCILEAEIIRSYWLLDFLDIHTSE
jgi:hypothetical protein